MQHQNRFRLLCAAFFLLCLTVCLAGCGNNKRDFDGQTKVIYELEGGQYQNCELPIVQYYNAQGGAHTIAEPSSLSNKPVTRAGYTLEGWYREKTVASDGTVTYNGRWDFATDTVTSEGVTLYARWAKNIKYTYEVCYRDEGGQVQVLGAYDTDEGKTFNTYYATKFAAKRTGYTALDGLYDSEDRPWDAAFTHPGGETDTAVQVFLHFVEGEYVLIHNAQELLRNKNRNLYLTCDIDFEGASFGGFGTYSGIIEGNGYAIRNFSLSYNNQKDGLVDDKELDDEGGLLCIGLFGQLSGATLRNLTIEDFTVNINVGYSGTKKIILSPFAVKAKDTVLKNISVSGTYEVTRLPNGFDREQNLIICDTAVYYRPAGDTTDPAAVTVSFSEKTDG